MHGDRREALLARVPLLAKWSGRMIQIKTAQELELMRASGLVTAGALAAVKAAVRPGVTAEQVDAAARDVIADAGWGEHFIHRTGHGIGLDSHEAPYIVAGNDLPLEPGMAFSVEPGIYLPGRCGARIEDIVVCTDDGVRVLNNGSRELVELPG